MEERNFKIGSSSNLRHNNNFMRHKEKRRTESLNKAFCELRKCIPHVPCDTKLSKIKTLQLASSYINHLSTLLKNPSCEKCDIIFKSSLPVPEKKHLNYIINVKTVPIKSSCISKPDDRLQLKKAKGRTGWPETVWAETLECSSNCSNKKLCSVVPGNDISTICDNGTLEKYTLFNFHHNDMDDKLDIMSSAMNIPSEVSDFDYKYSSTSLHSIKSNEPLPSISTLGIKARSKTINIEGNSARPVDVCTSKCRQCKHVLNHTDADNFTSELQPTLYYIENDEQINLTTLQ